MKISKLLRSDLIHLTANLECFNNQTIGSFMREVLTRERNNAELSRISNRKRYAKSKAKKSAT